MITENRAKRCVTHFHACDCREYKFQQMEQALKVIHVWSSSIKGLNLIQLKGLLELIEKRSLQTLDHLKNKEVD